MFHVDVTLEDVRLIGIDRGDGELEVFILSGDLRATTRLTFDEMSLGLCLALSHSGDGPGDVDSLDRICSKVYASLCSKLDALALPPEVAHSYGCSTNPFRFIP
jgi:hypothetical protein